MTTPAHPFTVLALGPDTGWLQNELTGEHTCIMISPLSNAQASPQWLHDYWMDFQRRFRALLPLSFKAMGQLHCILRDDC